MLSLAHLLNPFHGKLGISYATQLDRGVNASTPSQLARRGEAVECLGKLVVTTPSRPAAPRQFVIAFEAPQLWQSMAAGKTGRSLRR
jgi:hypothetical protein